MFFEKENLQFTMLGTSELQQENVSRHSRGRNFDALSFRFNADTDFVTEKSTQHVTDNYVCFVPANIKYDRIAKKDDLLAIHCHIKGYTANDIECFRPRNAEKIAGFFKDVIACWTKKEPGYMHKCYALFYQILAECCVQNAPHEQKESKIQASVNYINSNYTNPELSIKEIAEKSFMSEVYFRKIFKEEFGTSPQKHIIKLRLQKAAELIKTNDYSLKEVAFLSGYSDYKYFSSEFKRETGKSPSEYARAK